MGTAASVVNVEPPKLLKSISTSRCSITEDSAANARAQSSSTAWHCPYEKDMAYKKAMLGGVFKSTTTMNTQIKGQKFYNETFEQKHEEEIKKTKEFLWIYKG